MMIIRLVLIVRNLFFFFWIAGNPLIMCFFLFTACQLLIYVFKLPGGRCGFQCGEQTRSRLLGTVVDGDVWGELFQGFSTGGNLPKKKI